MNQDVPKLSQKQERAIAAMLSAGTMAVAAEQVGVTERTLRTWKKLPHFAEAFAAARRELLEHAVGRLQWASDLAVHVLVKELTSERSSDRLRAATAILDRAIKGGEMLDVEPRLAAIEAALRERGG